MQKSSFQFSTSLNLRENEWLGQGSNRIIGIEYTYYRLHENLNEIENQNPLKLERGTFFREYEIRQFTRIIQNLYKEVTLKIKNHVHISF